MLTNRRSVLRGTGVALTLPSLRSASAAKTGASAKASMTAPRRMVCIGNMLGFYPDAFFPKEAGIGTKRLASTNSAQSDLQEITSFDWGRSSQPLNLVSDSVSILTGLDHGLTGGHFAIHAFLSGVRHIDAPTRADGNVTLDQYAADWIGTSTRFPSLTIGSESGIHGGCQLSWTRSGTRVPPITGPKQLFEKLFMSSSEKEKSIAKNRLQSRGSILDFVNHRANSLSKKINQEDKQKLDEYFTSVRDVEKQLTQSINWLDVPKPEAPMDRPTNRSMVQDLPVLYELIRLALMTDSTRIASLEVGGDFNPRDLGVSGGYHALSHHGQLNNRIESLIVLERYQIEQFAKFVQKMRETKTEDGNLLDHSSILFGSGMGNANSHRNSNLPVVLAGGGMRHGRWLRYDEKSKHRPPLCNLFVSMLQDFGMSVDQFGLGTGTLRGLA
ncbi:MAG: DUF1552 domain-containing protein [Planctomycetota bacterium]